MNPLLQQTLSTMAKVGKYFFATVLVLFLLGFIANIGFWIIEVPLRILVGWAVFLLKVWPHITINAGLVAIGAGSFVVLCAGSHFFLVWVYRSYGGGEEGQVEGPPWRLQWTLAVVTIFFFMFVTSIAFTGVVHQVTWLATSPSPLLVTKWDRSFVKREAKTNLGGIYVAETAFYSENGRYGTFEEIGFVLSGSHRYTYRIDISGKPGTIFEAKQGAVTPDNIIVPAGFSPTSFTATATANLDDDPTLDQWHVNDQKQGLQQADVDDVTN